MKIVAKKDRKLLLINTGNTQNENKAETIELTVPEEYEDYNKKIVFVTDDGVVWDVITNNEYKITNAITKYKKVDFYIWLTKEVDGESIDFRTKTKTLNFYHNVDASDEITEEEIHGVNTVVNLLEEEIEKVENLDLDVTKVGSTATVTITKKDGTTESVDITDGQNGQDGKDGEDGKDAKINGKNSIEIEAGNNITIDNTETGIRINSTNDGGTTDYTDLENKPKINNVELSGNKSLNDLGIQPKGNYIEDNNYVHTDNNFNNTYKNKLEGLENYDDTEVKEDIEALQTENTRLKATLPTTTGEGEDITLDKTAELEFKKPPLPMGNSEQDEEPSPENEVPITNVTGDVEVKVQNKNLFNKNNVIDGYRLGSDGANFANPGYSVTDFIKVKPTTNFYRNRAITIMESVCLYDKDKNFISRLQNGNAFTTTENTYYIKTDVDNTYLNTTQLELGSTSATYTPHQEQTFTFPLGNEKLMLGDYLADDGIHHVRGQATESGTAITLNDAKSNGAYLCNKKTAGNLVGKTLTFDTAVTDALVEYELEEEIIVPYTSAQQEVYNQIKQAISYEEQTNISSNQNALFSVEAYQSTKLILENLESRLTLVEG